MSKVYVIRCTYDESIVGIHQTETGAKENLTDLYVDMAMDESFVPDEDDNTYVIEEHDLYA